MKGRINIAALFNVNENGLQGQHGQGWRVMNIERNRKMLHAIFDNIDKISP
jgi:hypothetical protein